MIQAFYRRPVMDASRTSLALVFSGVAPAAVPDGVGFSWSSSRWEPARKLISGL